MWKLTIGTREVANGYNMCNLLFAFTQFGSFVKSVCLGKQQPFIIDNNWKQWKDAKPPCSPNYSANDIEWIYLAIGSLIYTRSHFSVHHLTIYLKFKGHRLFIIFLRVTHLSAEILVGWLSTAVIPTCNAVHTQSNAYAWLHPNYTSGSGCAVWYSAKHYS